MLNFEFLIIHDMHVFIANNKLIKQQSRQQTEKKWKNIRTLFI